MQKIVYNYSTTDNVQLLSESLYESVHEMLSCILSYGLKKCSNKIDVIMYNKNKKHVIVVDTLHVDAKFILISECRKISCDLRNDVHQLREFCVFYDPNYSKGHNDYLMEMSIRKLFNCYVPNEYDISLDKSPKNKPSKIKTQNKNTSQKKEKSNTCNLSDDISNTLKTINELSKNVNTVPTIETVVFPDEIFSDDESSDSDSEGSIFEEPHPIVDIKKKIKNIDVAIDGEYCDGATDVDQNEIKKIKELKKSVDETIKDLKKTTESEESNLSRFACVVRDAEQQIKNEGEKDKRDYDIFVSEKEYTYRKIYHHFFVKKIIKDWCDIPILFMTKFVVYLYLDGFDNNGQQVRQKILGTDDEFRLFKLLYDSITDDEFEMPEDQKDIDLVNDFVNNIPPIILVSAEEIMSTLNNDDNETSELFKNDGTDQCSASEDEDDKINTYGSVPNH